MTAQLDLFGAPSSAAQKSTPRGVLPAPTSPVLVRLRERLPAALRLGTSSWSFPGWADIVYDRPASKAMLARDGLQAYASHPLLDCVGIDRSFYAPVPEETFAGYAAATPDGFRFVVKAHEWCTLGRFPKHVRYGASAGMANEHVLDPEYATRAVVAPAVAGLGDKLGLIVFQFPPQDPRALGGPRAFATRLDRFLGALPKGPRYAVELRNAELVTPQYADVMRAHASVHCLDVHPAMPPLEQQLSLFDPARGPEILVRWMLARHLGYEEARERFAPFDRVIEPDWPTRSALVDLIVAAAKREQITYVLANNKAEGCAPLSLVELAELVEEAL